MAASTEPHLCNEKTVASGVLTVCKPSMELKQLVTTSTSVDVAESITSGVQIHESS